MPNPAAVSAGVIALSMAVAAAIVVYESPEIRRMADDLRRRIAIALQSMGDSIAPDDLQDPNRPPVFNRPEDAEGFMLSSSLRGRRSSSSNSNSHSSALAAGGDPGVDADEESRRRQRDELLYWNRMRLEREQSTQSAQERWNPRDALDAMQRATREAAAAAGIQLPASFGGVVAQSQSQSQVDEERPPVPPKTSFDGVVNTGADAAGQPPNSELRRRGWNASVAAAAAGAAAAASYANPFGDEYGIEMDDQRAATGAASTTAAFGSSAYLYAEHDDMYANLDLYNASEPDEPSKTAAPATPRQRNSNNSNNSSSDSSNRSGSGVVVSEVYFDADRAPEVAESPVMTGENTGVYSSIQAWAQQTSNSSASGASASATACLGGSTSSTGVADFFSPLAPATPALSVMAMSEPEIVSDGERTPVESVVSTFWGDDVAVLVPTPTTTAAAAEAITPAHSDAASLVSAAESRDYDVVSDDDDGSSGRGVMTPTSWSEVGSVMTESDAGQVAA